MTNDNEACREGMGFEKKRTKNALFARSTVLLSSSALSYRIDIDQFTKVLRTFHEGNVFVLISFFHSPSGRSFRPPSFLGIRATSSFRLFSI